MAKIELTAFSRMRNVSAAPPIAMKTLFMDCVRIVLGGGGLTFFEAFTNFTAEFHEPAERAALRAFHYAIQEYLHPKQTPKATNTAATMQQAIRNSFNDTKLGNDSVSQKRYYTGQKVGPPKKKNKTTYVRRYTVSPSPSFG